MFFFFFLSPGLFLIWGRVAIAIKLYADVCFGGWVDYEEVAMDSPVEEHEAEY